ncbi:MAG: hypothetical protein ACKON7_02765, partial [Planctomycetaceae bacterium]
MQAAWIVGGVSAAAAAAGLAMLVRTRWLQSRTLEKCVGISLVVHAVLAVVCMLVGGMSPASWGTGDEGRMTMQVVLAAEEEPPPVAEGDTPPADEPPPTDAEPEPADAEAAPPAETMPATVAGVAPADVVPLLEPPPEPAPTAAASRGSPETGAAVAGSVAEPPSRRVPEVYADRVGARRAAAAAARGGSRDTELAVEAALSWLAA